MMFNIVPRVAVAVAVPALNATAVVSSATDSAITCYQITN